MGSRRRGVPSSAAGSQDLPEPRREGGGGDRGDVELCVWGLRRDSAAQGKQTTTKLLFVFEGARDASLPSISFPP